MALVDGPIFQLCWVVEDLEAAESWWTATAGVARWARFEGVAFGPGAATVRGRPAEYVIDVSLGYAGGQQLELIRPVSGTNLYTEHLGAHGPGFHHVAWIPDDFAAALARSEAAGRPVLQRGTMADVGLEFAYVDGGPLGCYVELMALSETMRAVFDDLVPPGFANPWAPATGRG